MRRVSKAVVLCLSVLALAGCGTLGPGYIEASRTPFIEVLARTDEQELLLNIVRLRHAEAPVFVQVEGITVAPSAQVSVTSAVPFIDIEDATVTNAFTPTLTIADNPTIVYNPLLGTEFARKLLVPLQPTVILLLSQNGWGLDQLFPLMVRSIEGIRDVAGDADRYDAVVAAIGRLERSGALVLGTSEPDADGSTTLLMRISPDGHRSADGRLLAEALSIDPDRATYRLESGFAAAPDTIAIEMRPLLSVLHHVGAGVETADRSPATPGLAAADVGLHIRSGSTAPLDAFAAVPARGRWFWIDGGDGDSKATLLLIRLLFNLQAQGDGDSDTFQLTLPVR